jgi:4-amino-4-deoxy-L-arabinose transferase-like glycosyltransferase
MAVEQTIQPLHRVRPVTAVTGRRGVALAVIAIVGVYIVTRVSFITRFPYFLDEGTYADFTYQGAHSLSDLFVSLTIGREPLQIWLGIPFVKLGFNPLNALRIVSMLSGLLTVGVVGLLGRRLGGTAVGLVAAALCVVLPFFVVHNGIGIMESLVTLIMASALYLQIELARRPDFRLAPLLGAVLAAGVLTKENTKPAVALIPLSLLCFDWSPADRRRRLVVWLQCIAVALVMVIGAELLLRSSSLYSQLEAVRRTAFYTVRPLHDVLADPFGSWGKAWSAYRPAFTGYVTVPLIAAAVAGAVLAWRRRPRMTAVLVGWFALPFVISMTFAALPYPRHVMYLLPPAIAFMAYALVEGGRWAQRTMPRPAAAVACAVVGLVVLLPALRLDARVLAHPVTAPYPGLDTDQYVTGSGVVWPRVAKALRRRAPAGRVVILSPKADTNILHALLGYGSRFVFVKGASPSARQARFSLTDSLDPFVDPEAISLARQGHFVPVERFYRTGRSGVVTLYERPSGGGRSS